MLFFVVYRRAKWGRLQEKKPILIYFLETLCLFVLSVARRNGKCKYVNSALHIYSLNNCTFSIHKLVFVVLASARSYTQHFLN